MRDLYKHLLTYHCGVNTKIKNKKIQVYSFSNIIFQIS